MLNRILITGGAGFVGSQLAKSFRQKFPNMEIICFDNLRRRGSELNLSEFKKMNIKFLHGDIRNPADFEGLNENFDFMIEASAEPSVLAGMQGDSPRYAIETNLFGTVNALEFVKKSCGGLIFLSTSRVYSIPNLQKLPLRQNDSRLELSESNHEAGYSPSGISEKFSTKEFRSIYGTTKLASEMLIQEYSQAYGVNATINRCGVIAGPGQFGKVDQGVFTFWVARHMWGMPLQYNGYGGKGFQVRDLLHPDDLFELIEKQMQNKSNAEIFNVGGGESGSISLFELTEMCKKITQKNVEIKSNQDTSSVDVPYFVTDSNLVSKRYQWKPKKNVAVIVKDIYEWLSKNENNLKPLFT